MMITWICVALCLHEAQFHDGRWIFMQSKKEHDADELKARAEMIYLQQPAWMRQRHRSAYCRLEFPRRKSVIMGIPQGAHKIRMHTASIIFSDEAAFQPEMREAFTAAKPCIDGGGKIVLVSSAKDGWFWDMTLDRVEMIDATDDP
jgi:hypothetical protein